MEKGPGKEKAQVKEMEMGPEKEKARVKEMGLESSLHSNHLESPE